MFWEKTTDGDVVIIRITGPINSGQDISAVQQSVCRDLDCGYRRFVVDFDDARLVRSSRMGLFLGMLAAARCRGAEIVLSQADQGADSSRCLSRLLSLFRNFGDRQHAVAALHGVH